MPEWTANNALAKFNEVAASTTAASLQNFNIAQMQSWNTMLGLNGTSGKPAGMPQA